MTGAGVETLLFLLDEAFEGGGIEESGESQALMTNLRTVDEAAWRARPPGVARSIESMALHVGSCKVMYADYAFGEKIRGWDDPVVQPWPEGAAPIGDAFAWLRETQRTFRAHVAGLDDADLDAPRMTNWGQLRPTRWIVAAIIGHDFYHAGEINHLRSLLSGEDRWRWVQHREGAAGGS